MTPVEALNKHPDVVAVLDMAAQAFVERLSAGYENQKSRGGAEFKADIWYHFTTKDGEPVIEFLVVVSQPVFGLAPYLSRLGASMAGGFDWKVDFVTKVRLAEETNEKRLGAAGWRHW